MNLEDNFRSNILSVFNNNINGCEFLGTYLAENYLWIKPKNKALYKDSEILEIHTEMMRIVERSKLQYYTGTKIGWISIELNKDIAGMDAESFDMWWRLQ